MTHDDYSSADLIRILRNVKTIALVGVSANPARASYIVVQYLLGKGYDVYPVNPALAGQEILGRTVYGSLADIPVPLDMVDIFRNSQAAGGITDEVLALDPKPKVIWMQLTVYNEDAAARAEKAGLTVIMNRCPKMEYGKLSGEWAWIGGFSGQISSKKLKLHASGKVQSLGLAHWD